MRGSRAAAPKAGCHKVPKHASGARRKLARLVGREGRREREKKRKSGKGRKEGRERERARGRKEGKEAKGRGGVARK